MREIPCKDCISYAICKAQVNDYVNKNSHVFIESNSIFIAENYISYHIYQDILKPKCSLISEWFCNVSGHKNGITSYRIKCIGTFFKIKYNQKEP